MTTSIADTIKSKVQNYYKLVDDSTGITEVRILEGGRQKEGGKFTRNPQMVQQIVDMFHDNGTYIRQGSESTPFRGKEGLTAFFGSKRFLVGQHAVESIEVKSGIDANLSTDFMRNYASTDTSTLQTVKVIGTFTGAKMTVGKEGFADHAEGTPLPFIDYWVYSGDKALYRYSEIKREQVTARY